MGVRTLYQKRVAAGGIAADAAQEQVVDALNRLALELNRRPRAKPGLLGRLMGQKPASPPRGLYIHGEVGRGKTMLMDLFFAAVHGVSKRRVHFHAFMQDVHARRKALKSGDVITRIAAALASEARLLCLDEMQVTDIADAMVIGRLFEALEAEGVCFVTTSNLPPEGLYQDGLNRQLFLPFIARLRHSLDVLSLQGGHDYRLGRFSARDTYIHPLGRAAAAKAQGLWQELTGTVHGSPETLTVLGRPLPVPEAAHATARFSFADLCEQPRGAADYLALARRYRSLFLMDVPQLTRAQRNEARRLVLLIDTLYDAGTRLVITAAGPPDQIYPAGDHRFEFSRTISRLMEMQSAAWWGGHLTDASEKPHE
jgi:cell division protein ZapE